MLKTIRNLITYLIQSCGDIDDPVGVKIVRRNEEGVVTHIALLPISYIDVHDSICVEESEINWVKYT
jgi:hypothetical protein